ncbi:PAS domain-containing protein [Dyadobacter sandarakinus]|uniref:histidine kinase n=1 Tax=Dyadobacter sandarakinus TaxID=2747268 RepID=A0ABX7I594_9BACT|nr:PAS domain-containing protein [Dyadobacter sandarakinus]QRR00712.1 PAS domain-containing protein [Dyadobacter sandarakinus]
MPRPFDFGDTSEMQRIELALDLAGVGMWEFDDRTGRLSWNGQAAHLLGFYNQNHISLDILKEQVHPDDRPLFAAWTNYLPGNDAAFSFEFRLNGSDPSRQQWIFCKGKNHFDPNLNTIRTLGTFTDITKEAASRAADAEQQQHARSFQTIVEQAPMAIGLLTGPDQVIELGNEKIFEVWGKSPAITGMKLADALPEINDQQFLDLLAHVYQTGESYAGSGVPARLERNNRMEEVYFDFVYTPMRTGDGSVSGVMVLAHEVTGQYRMLKELEASEAKFRALIDQAPVATCLFVGREMVVEMANQPMIDYWGKDVSVIGKPLREILPELEGQPFLDILDDILRTGVAYSATNAEVELEVAGKLGTYYFNFTYKPIFDNTGNIYGIINMAIDVTTQVLAQRALEESESKLRTVIASAPAAIGLFVGRNLIVELPNQTFIDIVGKGPDIAGTPLREVMPELESQPFLQILDDVFTSGVTYRSFGTPVDIVQHGVMTHNYYDITYSPVYDKDGHVYAVLDIAIDVSERVNVEKQIRESQLQLLALFEQSPIGIAMIQKEGLTFTMANPFYGQMVGRLPGEIIGKPLLEALPEIAGQGFDTLLDHVMETGIPYISKEQPVDISYDGELKTIYVNLAYQPQRDREGTIAGVLVVATDLTEQVLSRKKIEETQTFLQGAIELAELGTYSIDLNAGTLHYSDRLKHWFGLQHERVITFQKVYAAISRSDLPGVIAAVNRAIAPGSDGHYDMEYTLDAEKTGATRVLHSQGRVLYDSQGRPHTMIGTAQDVTTQRRIKLALEQQVQERTEELEATNEELAALNEEYVSTNEELSEANNMLQQSNVNLQQFAYVASHDLQEPLRKIQSFSDLLVNRYGEQVGEGITYLRRMQGSAKRMSDLIADLLAFSRITAQKEVLSSVSLTGVIIDAVSDLELAITESGAMVHIGNLPEIKGDPMQLSQLFLNLLSNAVKFRKPGVSPVIEITGSVIPGTELPKSVRVVRQTSMYHRIDVADNGIGFNQQHAERIFQLFQRLHGKSEYSGTGIGLTICESVAANHGGGISVTSEPGQGATFSIFFPGG